MHFCRATAAGQNFLVPKGKALFLFYLDDVPCYDIKQTYSFN